MEVCHHEEFLSLLPAKLVELTSSDNLQVDKEEAVFQAVARWYNNKPDIRRTDFYKVLIFQLLNNFYYQFYTRISLTCYKKNY